MPHAGRTRSRYWRQIAVAADRAPRTMYAIAKEIGTEGGALQSAFESMCSDGVLRAKPGPNGERLYSLTAKGKRHLAETDRAVDARKALPANAPILLVVDEGHAIAPELLHDLAAEPTLAWSLRLEGIVRWLAVFESDDAAPVDRVAACVEAAGARPIVGRADAIYNAAELAEYAARIAALPRALPA